MNGSCLITARPHRGQASKNLFSTRQIKERHDRHHAMAFEDRVGETPVHESIIVSLVSLLWVHGRHELPICCISAVPNGRPDPESEVLGVRVNGV